jgi:MFS family permease
MIRLSEPAYVYADKHMPKSWRRFFDRYSSGGSTIKQKSTWNKLLKALMRIVVMYSAVSVVLILLWLRFVDGVALTPWDVAGASIALVGMAALLFAPLNAVTFFAAIACVAFNFGGTITVFPSLVSEFFGLNNLAKNYGVIYLGFGIGSICGSIIASLFGGFYVTFYVIFALLILSLALSTTIRQPEQKMLREAHGSL